MQTVGMERLGSVVARIAARLVRHEEFRDPASSTRSAGQIGGEAPRRGSTSPCGGGRAEAGDAVGPPQPGGSAEEARCESRGPVRRPASARRPLAGTGAHTTRPELAGAAGLKRGLVGNGPRARVGVLRPCAASGADEPVQAERRAERAPSPDVSPCVCPLCESGSSTNAAGVWAARESTRNSVPRHASTPFSTRSPRTELICCAHDPST